MKKLLLVFFLLVLSSCSFDNKTGIWKDALEIPDNSQASKTISDSQPESRYEDIYTKGEIFNEEKKITNPTDFKIDAPLKIINWHEEYVIPTNNVSNFSYNGTLTLLSKSSSLSKSLPRATIFYKNNLISHDHKGTIFIYSLSLKKKIYEYNFYKKNFKKVKKKINFILNENILYAADNLGYLYAINLEKKNIVWAKNYGVSFRSNLKLLGNQIFLANQDNVIYSIDTSTGDKKWQFQTGSTVIKSDFENNFALDLINNNLLFLNTSGEFYSINYLTQKVNWVLNFKNPSLIGANTLFLSQPLIIKNDNVVISTEKSILSYSGITGARNWILPSEPIFKPIVSSGYVYALLKNNLLICLNNINGEVIWSKNIFANVKDKKIKSKIQSIIDFKIVNGKINIYSKYGYLISFNPSNGSHISHNRISKSGITSNVFFLNDNMFFFDRRNKLLKFN